VTKIRLVGDARREFLREIAYYEDIRKGLGRKFRSAAAVAFKMAAALPFSGKPGIAETRTTANPLLA
jgi:hypothetical protein